MEADELNARLQLKKKIASVLQQHEDVLEILGTQTRKVQTDFLLEFARNISYSLSAPPNYKEGGETRFILRARLVDRILSVVPLSRYYHPPAPLPVEMRQGKVIATGVKDSCRPEVTSAAEETSISRGQVLKRKHDVEEKAEKKPRIDLNFGLDSDDEG